MAGDPKKLLALLARQHKSLRAALRKPEAIDRRIKKTLAELREAIKAGGTTGDKILDFVISRYGWDEKTKTVERFYRALDARFRASVGQFVLLTYTHKKQVCLRDPGPSEPDDFITVTNYYLGIVKDGGLILKTDSEFGLWELPTEKYAVIRRGGDTDIREGNILPPECFFFDLYVAISGLAKLESTLTLLVGDDEVKNSTFGYKPAFESPHFKRYAELLGRTLP